MPRPRHDSGDPSDAANDATASSIADDRDRDEDRVSDLPRDLAGDLSSDLGKLQIDVDAADEEVWFEAEALAAASKVQLGVELGGDHGAGNVSLVDQLRARMERPGISLVDLPSWPPESDSTDGPALGPALADLLGELRAGDLILVGGRGRGAGRTSLLSQLADALALRASGPETPVLCMVEGPAMVWRARSLGRWSGIDARQFLAPGGVDVAAHLAAFEAGEWRDLDARQRFVDASLLREPARRGEWLDMIERRRRGSVGDVWPVLVIDSIDQMGGARETLDERLASLERLAGDHGLVVLASCDEPDPADARRLDRHAQARLRVSGSGETLDIELCHRRLGPLESVRLRWDRASGRIGGP